MSLTTPVGQSNTLYLTIAGGSMVQKSSEDNPEAKKRTYEDKDGNTHTKYEVHHRNLTGNIQTVKFHQGKFGENCEIHIVNGDSKAVLSVGTDSDYFTDFAKRLPNVDLSKPVTLNPYEMDKEGSDRKNRGISIKQGDEKILNAYWDADKKKTLKSFPNVSADERKDFDSDDWKMFFIKVKKFLKRKIEAMEFSNVVAQPATSVSSSASTDEDDLPF